MAANSKSIIHLSETEMLIPMPHPPASYHTMTEAQRGEHARFVAKLRAARPVANMVLLGPVD